MDVKIQDSGVDLNSYTQEGIWSTQWSENFVAA